MDAQPRFPAPGSPDLVHLSPGAVLKSLAEILRSPSGLAAPIAPHGLGGPIAGLRRVVPAGSRLPWPAGRWGHEGRGVRGEVWAKFRGRPSAPGWRQRLQFSSFLPAQVVSGCGLPGRPASSLPAPAPAHLLRPVPPSAIPPHTQEAPPLSPEPPKRSTGKCWCFLSHRWLVLLGRSSSSWPFDTDQLSTTPLKQLYNLSPLGLSPQSS